MSFQTAKDIREIKFRSLHNPFNNTDYYNCEDVDDYLELLAQQMNTFIRTIEHYVDCPLVARAHRARQIVPAEKETENEQA